MPYVYPGSTSFITRGASYAIGTIIDAYLSAPDCNLLYSTWKAEWPTPLEFSGAITAITCEQVLEVPETEFVSVFKVKRDKEAAGRILAAAKNNAGR
jgi:hypothetical protein